MTREKTNPRQTITGTPTEIAYHLASLTGSSALSKAAQSVAWDDASYTTPEGAEAALRWLSLTWPTLRVAVDDALRLLSPTASTPAPPADDVDPRYKRAHDSLAAFAQLCGARGRPFKLRKATRLIIGKLEEAVRNFESGGRARLVICVPPRVGKTLIVSRIFPAWFLGRNPAMSTMVCSHSKGLAAEIGDSIRNYIRLPEYEKVFPGVKLSTSSKSKTGFNLTTTDAEGVHEAGEFGSYGRGGGYTGHGANLLIVDDLMKEKEVDSEAKLADAHGAVQALTSRLDPEDRTIMIVVNTRYRENDVVGYVLSEYAGEGPWDVIAAPLIADHALTGQILAKGGGDSVANSDGAPAENDDGSPIAGVELRAQIADHYLPPVYLLDGTLLEGEVWHRPDGDVMEPYKPARAHAKRETLLRTKPHEWYGQYQCSPVAASGNMINPADLKPFTVTPLVLDRRSYIRVVISVDTGEGRTITGARSAIGVYGEPFDARNACEVCAGAAGAKGACTSCRGSGLGPAVRLLEVLAYPWQSPDQIAVLKAVAGRWKADMIVIEAKSSGPGVAQALRRDPTCWKCEGREPAARSCVTCNGTGHWVRCAVQLEDVQGDKVVRMSRALPAIRDGQIGVPADCRAVPSSWVGVGWTVGADWVAELRTEAMHFPRGRYKDRCDQLSQYVNYRTLNPLPRVAGVSPNAEVAGRSDYGAQSRRVSEKLAGGQWGAF